MNHFGVGFVMGFCVASFFALLAVIIGDRK